jgi:hypothetical protein
MPVTPSRWSVSHWGDTKVVASLVAAALLLVAFGVIEGRSRHALLPLRILAAPTPAGCSGRC